MKTLVSVSLALILATSPGMLRAADKDASSEQTLESLMTQGGLEKIQIKGIDLAYMRPGASLAGYKKVMIGPIQVSFVRNFGRAGSGYARATPAEMQKIRERLSETLREEATAELAKGGYQVVDAPGEGVLGVAIGIVNLRLTAPDTMSSAGTRIFALSAGEMTLVSELSDSPSGEILVRAYDREEATESIKMHAITAGENRAEARKIAREWALILRNQLDQANAEAGTPAG